MWQWNEADINGDGSSRGLRGGNWLYYSDSLASSFRADIGHPSNENYIVGFRVASVPEPGSICSLVGAAIIGLLSWKRRK